MHLLCPHSHSLEMDLMKYPPHLRVLVLHPTSYPHTPSLLASLCSCILPCFALLDGGVVAVVVVVIDESHDRCCWGCQWVSGVDDAI